MPQTQVNPERIVAQSGVIPYRMRNGRVEIALVTASNGPHWTVPKGHLERDLTPAESAAKEAYEESGLVGEIHSRRVGHYVYQKRGSLRHVDLYALEVTRELRRWPEMLVRERRWMSVNEAASRVRSAELRCCLQKFERTVLRSQTRNRRALAA